MKETRLLCQPVLKISEPGFEECLKFLYLHGILTDKELAKARQRVEKRYSIALGEQNK